MSIFDSNESFDNKIYLVYWLWLKMNESEILDMTVVQSEMLQGTRMCKQSKTKRTDKFISFQKGSQLFSIDCTFFLRHGTVLIEIYGVLRNSNQNHKNENKIFSVGMTPNKTQKIFKVGKKSFENV